jgi:uncharacterized membrane protein HdeD (DUF308 family)
MTTLNELAREDLDRLTRGMMLRGVLAIAFALVLLAWPGLTLRVLVLAFGTYSLVDGAVALYNALVSSGTARRWWLVIQGLAGVGVGVATYLWTGLTAIALLHLIGTWAIVLGVLQIAEAMSSSRVPSDRITMALGGLLGIFFGVIMWWRPGAGAVALVTLIAAFATVTGVTLVVVALQLRSRVERLTTLHTPAGPGAR